MTTTASHSPRSCPYYLCLAFFPALLFLLALSSFFSLHVATDDVAGALGPFVSPDLLALIQDQMRRLADANDGGLLTVGVLGALWGTSTALVAIVSSVNRAYDLPETRPWWRVRLTAALLTLALAVIVIAAGTLVIAGPTIARLLGLVDTNAAMWVWNVVRWPAAFALVAFGVGLILLLRARRGPGLALGDARCRRGHDPLGSAPRWPSSSTSRRSPTIRRPTAPWEASSSCSSGSTCLASAS